MSPHCDIPGCTAFHKGTSTPADRGEAAARAMLHETRRCIPPHGSLDDLLDGDATGEEHRAALLAAQPEDDGLDVERLAEALHIVENHVFDDSTGLHLHGRTHPIGATQTEQAQQVAAEYARLLTPSEPSDTP